jgi:hypothetical protein
VTICDLTGGGARDTVIAIGAVAKCRDLRIGAIIAT